MDAVDTPEPAPRRSRWRLVGALILAVAAVAGLTWHYWPFKPVVVSALGPVQITIPRPGAYSITAESTHPLANPRSIPNTPCNVTATRLQNGTPVPVTVRTVVKSGWAGPNSVAYSYTVFDAPEAGVYTITLTRAGPPFVPVVIDRD